MIAVPENAFFFTFALPSGTEIKVVTERPVPLDVCKALYEAGVISVIATLPEIKPYGGEPL